MALVKYGGGIIQMSGSLAGNTHARNRYGNYIRARTKPINPNTARQQTVRAAIAYLTERWADTLTAVQRTAWGLYASNVAMKNKLGESIKLSGFNHYIRSNMNLQQNALTIIDAAPTVFELPEKDSTLAITASEASQNISVAFTATLDWALETGAYLVCYLGQPQNPQRNFFGGPYRMMDNVAGIDTTGATTPDVQAAPFAVAELQRIWMYARVIRKDGRLSQKFFADCFVAA